MLDIETLGTSQGSKIIQIAAVMFDVKTGETGKFINLLINPFLSSGKIDGPTVDWWRSQGEDVVNKVLTTSIVKGFKEDIALNLFEKFVNDHEPERVWGNGSSFDNAQVEAIYQRNDRKCPFSFRQSVDVRTLVFLAKELKGFDKSSVPFTGMKHEALDDCLHQIEYCHKAYSLLEIKNEF